MSLLTVTAKGQITLRKELLRRLGVGPGDRLIAELLPDGRLALARPSGDISRVFGMLKREGAAPLSLEEMNEAARGGWAGEP